MDATRHLIVAADDFGIGPETSRGILELASRGLVTATVLIVNSPHAADAVRAWRRAGRVPELGWHPCLTMDPPAAGVAGVPSLVGPDGCMGPLGWFLSRLGTGRIRADEIARELTAQYERFVELVGVPPSVVNAHQHIALFPPVGRILRRLLERQYPAPYVRRVAEPASTLARIPGARLKRGVLTVLGRLQASGLRRVGMPGPDWLAGITDPPWVRDRAFFGRWLTTVPGRTVELVCHPGLPDGSLAGRDGAGPQPRREDEYRLLTDPSFEAACREAGFTRVSPAEWRAGVRREAA